jgi:hypothetical protein
MWKVDLYYPDFNVNYALENKVGSFVHEYRVDEKPAPLDWERAISSPMSVTCSFLSMADRLGSVCDKSLVKKQFLHKNPTSRPHEHSLNNTFKMKRKLDANDVPVPTGEADEQKDKVTFAGLGLDARLLQGIAKQKFQAPTLVQAKAIPLALDGRDVLARAKTGSGKTAAYILPILHSILKRKLVCMVN